MNRQIRIASLYVIFQFSFFILQLPQIFVERLAKARIVENGA